MRQCRICDANIDHRTACAPYCEGCVAAHKTVQDLHEAVDLKNARLKATQVCEFCGKSAAHRRKGSRYCSKACIQDFHQAAASAEKQAAKPKCQRCGEAPIGRNARQYCKPCKAIRIRENTARNNALYKERHAPPPVHLRQPLPILDLYCSRCGNHFMGKRGSKKCDWCLVLKDNKLIHPLLERFCGECGTDIRDRNATAKFCKSCADMRSEIITKEWSKTHPRVITEERKLQRKLRRKMDRDALKAAGRQRISVREWRYIKQQYESTCAYCNEPEANTLDHVLAIINGGMSVAENCVPACHACNSEKSDTLLEDWRRGKYAGGRGLRCIFPLPPGIPSPC